MSFNPDNIQIVSRTNTDSPNVYTYFTNEDTVAEVSANNYFSPNIQRVTFNRGDKIEVTATDGFTTLTYNGDGSVTTPGAASLPPDIANLSNTNPPATAVDITAARALYDNNNLSLGDKLVLDDANIIQLKTATPRPDESASIFHAGVGNDYFQIIGTSQADIAGAVNKANANQSAIALQAPRISVLEDKPIPINLIENVWDKNTFNTAIAANSCIVTIVGTSITEGYVSQSENQNTYVNQLKRALRAKYPTVNFTFYNLGLASRQLADYVQGSYQGLASEPADKRTGYYREVNADAWPAGSTVGQSWQDAVEATAPDLLIFEFGMNDRDDPDVFAGNLKTAIADARTWTKSPSIALVSSMLPAKTAPFYNDVFGNSLIARNVAINNRCGLIDVGGVWNLASNGFDVNSYEAQRIAGVSNWTQFQTPQNLTDTSFNTSGGARLFDFGEYNGVRIKATFTPNATNSNYAVYAHLVDGDTGLANPFMWVIRLASSVRVYDKVGNIIVNQDIGQAVAAGVAEDIDIRIENGFVEIYVDEDLKVSDIIDSVKGFGGIGMGITNGGSAANIEVDTVKFDAYSAYRTDAQLLGTQDANAWNGGDYSEGGNALNHPSRQGLKEVFLPVTKRFVSSL